MKAGRSTLWAAAAAVATIAIVLLAACKATPLTQPSWPAPSDPMARAKAAGFEPTNREYLITHTHVHLDVLVDGTAVPIPAGIGIDTKAKGVLEAPTPDGTGKDYQVMTCDQPCLSELHTHDPDGILHSESKVPDNAPATLGQFFTEWGVRLDGSCVGDFCTSNTSIAVYVDGKKTDGNPADIKLMSHLEIAVIIGKPPEIIPDSWDFLPSQ
ncbi:MAG: hypothetical protein M3P14_12775 [Chloroflexota bacterium]|nr:hypothetical protein [Chloroflexota bacterium]